MFTVYAIKSLVDGRIYVGFTKNLQRRLDEHNNGRVRSTKFYVPWVIIYTEPALDRLSARLKEKKLKSGSGKEFLKRQD
jgi:putative endonuclease